MFPADCKECRRRLAVVSADSVKLALDDAGRVCIHAVATDFQDTDDDITWRIIGCFPFLGVTSEQAARALVQQELKDIQRELLQATGHGNILSILAFCPKDAGEDMVTAYEVVVFAGNPRCVSQQRPIVAVTNWLCAKGAAMPAANIAAEGLGLCRCLKTGYLQASVTGTKTAEASQLGIFASQPLALSFPARETGIDLGSLADQTAFSLAQL